jgi:hypothetical protein
MQVTMIHLCDEAMFFLWVPYVQMLVVINISLDLLIGTWIQINNFIIKRTMWLFIDKKILFVSINGLLKSRNMDWSSD